MFLYYIILVLSISAAFIMNIIKIEASELIIF